MMSIHVIIYLLGIKLICPSKTNQDTPPSTMETGKSSLEESVLKGHGRLEFT